MSEHDQHSSFIKTPQQLLVVILLSFLVPILGIVLLVQLVTGGPTADPAALSPQAVGARIQPVGRVEFGEPGAAAGAPSASPAPVATAPAAPAPAAKPAAADGKKVYDSACFACHATSVAGSPKLGDKAAWAPRIQSGLDALVQSVLKGKGAMPPKGGNAALSEGEIRAAVEFMVSQAK
jgi:cytochrome c5